MRPKPWQLAGKRRATRLLVLVATLLAASLLPVPACAQPDNLVDAVKATYLTKLGDFITWPPAAIPAHGFVICLIGQSPLAAVLVSMAAGQSVQLRPILVKQYASVVANPGCQMMFIAGPDTQTVENVLAAVRGAPVLTVTDGELDETAAGIINFVLQGSYVRFEINQAEAAENGLTISSKLLSLALDVRSSGTGP